MRRGFILFLLLFVAGCDLHPIIIDTFDFSDQNNSANYGEPVTRNTYGEPKLSGDPNSYGNPNKYEKSKIVTIKTEEKTEFINDKKESDKKIEKNSERKEEKNKTSEKTVEEKNADIEIKNEKEINETESKIKKIEKSKTIVPKEKIELIEEDKKDVSTEIKIEETVKNDDKNKEKIVSIEKENPKDNSEEDDILIVPARVKTLKKAVISYPKQDTITIQKGDTLYSLSKKYNFVIRDMIEQNNLEAPFILKPGSVLKFPNIAYHTVSAGETLYSISRNYKIDLNSLAKINNLSSPYSLAVGQKLRLSAPISTTEKLVVPESIVVKKATEIKPIVNKVKDEGKSKDKKIEIKTKEIKNDKTKTKATETKVKSEIKKNEIKKQPSVKKPEINSITKPDSRSSSKFSWPVKGKVISNFGTKANGLYNDGINVSAKFGTPVLAAENGVIAYAGNEIKGLGNLIIIQHANSWMTVYAHLNEISVSRGQKVKVGQKIGAIGQTGRVSSPQLHFEIRKDTRAFDPIKQLKAK